MQGGQGQGIYILNQDSKREQGKNAQVANIKAAKVRAHPI
jgi:hypothetical protein